MKYIIKIFTLLFLFAEARGQNNAIFTGGSGDGWSGNGYQQIENNIFNGGNGDGWSSSTYQQLENNIFSGGSGDGWSNSPVATFQLIVDNINENSFGEALTAFPNPTHDGVLNISLDGEFGNISLEVYDASGQLKLIKQSTSSTLIPLEIEGAAGLYFIKVKSENRFATIRVIKQ